MKKHLLAALALSFLATTAFAATDQTNSSGYKLIEKLKRQKKAGKLDQAAVVKFMPSPGSDVEQGAAYSVFIAPLNSYTESNVLLDAKIDGLPVGLIHSSENLWIYHAEGFSEQRSHDLTVSLAVEKKDLANQIRASVDKLSKEIFGLQQKIDSESDPVKRATYISQRDEKIAIKNELIRQLADLKTSVASQTFTFNVVPANSNANFPKLTAVSPQAGGPAGGSQITISGENFVPGMSVKIGGLNALATFVNATTITATTPNFGAAFGIKDLEVRFPPLAGSSEVRNSFLRNAYFVTNASLDRNVAPVAVGGPHHSFLLGDDMFLDGSGSYDENGGGTVLSYEWKVVDAPAGSGFSPGQIAGNTAQPHLALPVVGYYIFELRVTEANTPDHLVSEPSLATLEVHGPVNHAPVPSASDITAASGGTFSTTIAPNDPDTNQSWTFTVITPPAHGNAPVNGQGVMYYTSATGYTGPDSVTVRVTDNGTPPMYGDKTINIAVGPANLPPAPLPLTITVSNGVSATGQINPNDPNPGQSFIYQIVGQPSHGFAGVNASGLVTYNANQSYNGTDSLRVRVFDNGVPQKFADLVVNVVIPNRPPVLQNSFYEVHSQGLPVSTTIFNFDGDMDGAVVERSVDYGDGSPVDKSSNSENFFHFDHEYAALGTYNVTLTSKDNQGAVSIDHLTVNITNQGVPFPKFTMSTDRGTAPLTVTFDASSSVAGDTPITKYSFAFGDGGAGDIDGSNPVQSYMYTNPGIYTVFIYTGDDNHGRNYTLGKVYVDAPPATTGAESYARMEVDGAREVTVGSTVSFSAANSNNPNIGGSFTGYDWAYGDYLACPGGCTGHTAAPTSAFQYNNVGSFFTGVTATTNQGDIAMGGTSVYVVNSGHAPRPIIANSGPTATLSGVGHFTFDANGIGSYDLDGAIQSYLWSFSDFNACPTDGCTASGPFASHTYATPGFYFANLQVTDNSNNVNAAYVGITVTPSYKVATRLDSPQDNPQRAAQRRNLMGACATKNAPACYFLGKMYAEDGDSFTATQLYQKSCGLGYQPACSAR